MEEGPERVVVQGQVSYDGEPVQDGRIRFVPTGETEAPSSGAVIENGKYVADGQGGVPVGTHEVKIEGFRPREGAESLPDGVNVETQKDQYLPAKYNEESTLEMTVEPGQKKSIDKDFELEE